MNHYRETQCILVYIYGLLALFLHGSSWRDHGWVRKVKRAKNHTHVHAGCTESWCQKIPHLGSQATIMNANHCSYDIPQILSKSQCKSMQAFLFHAEGHINSGCWCAWKQTSNAHTQKPQSARWRKSPKKQAGNKPSLEVDKLPPWHVNLHADLEPLRNTRSLVHISWSQHCHHPQPTLIIKWGSEPRTFPLSHNTSSADQEQV